MPCEISLSMLIVIVLEPYNKVVSYSDDKNDLSFVFLLDKDLNPLGHL